MYDVKDHMNPEQLEQLKEPMAWSQAASIRHPLGADPFRMTGHFHQVMGLPAPDVMIVPSVSMRLRRGGLILEEFLELLEAMGLSLTFNHGGLVGAQQINDEDIGLVHIEGSRYDPVETLDALADLNVVVNGTGVEFGLPVHFANYEVYCSNLTKLESDGSPIVNHCKTCGPNDENIYHSECVCGHTDQWLDPTAPLGKILKPAGFTRANIARVLGAYQGKELGL